METHDKIGRKSGHFPPTDKEIQAFEKYQHQLITQHQKTMKNFSE